MDRKDWNGNTVQHGSWVLYTQKDIVRIAKVLFFTEDGKVLVEWHKSQWGGLPSKPGKVKLSNLTVMGWTD